MAYNPQQQVKKLKLTTVVTGQIIDKYTVTERGQERYEYRVYNKEFKDTLIVRVPEKEFDKFSEGDYLEVPAEIYVLNQDLRFYCKEPKKATFPRAVNNNESNF